MTGRLPQQVKALSLMARRLGALSLLAFLLNGPAGADDVNWQEDFPRNCIFPADGLEEPEPCRSFYRVSDRYADDGSRYTTYDYRWIGSDGREVVYVPDVGGFAMSRFTIGTLHDNRYDGGRTFKPKVNMEMVDLESLDAGDLEYVKGMIVRHVEFTGSTRGQEILNGWEAAKSKFVKVMPVDYKRALEELRKLSEQDQAEARKQEKVHG